MIARQLVFAQPMKVSYIDVPLRDPGPGEVLARTVLSGISHGTELSSFLGVSPFVQKTLTPERAFRPRQADDPPFYPFHWAGYDAVGLVERVGEGVTGYRPGDRVWRQVPHQTAFLFHQDAHDALRLADSLPDDDAIMINLSSVALGGILDAEIKLGDVVAVFGGGLVGQVAVQMAFLSGARRVFLSEPSAERRRFAQGKSPVETIDPARERPALAIHAGNEGQPPDVCIECSGNVRGLADAIAAAGVAGTVVAVGMYNGPASDLSFSEEFLHNRVTIKNSMTKWGCPSRFRNWGEGRILRQTSHLMERREIDLGGIVTGRFPFDQAQLAYEAIHREPGKYLKAALVYG